MSLCRVNYKSCVSPGWENPWIRKPKSLSSRSRADASNEEEGFHFVLYLVKAVKKHNLNHQTSNPKQIHHSFHLFLSPPVFINVRFVNVLVYYGLSLGVSRLGTNLYLTQFVFGLVEIPARSLVLVVLPFSRRFSQSGFLATGGLACLLMLAVPAGMVSLLCFAEMHHFNLRWN